MGEGTSLLSINESLCLGSGGGSSTRGASLGLPPSPQQNLLGGLCRFPVFQGKFRSTLGEGTESSTIYGAADSSRRGDLGSAARRDRASGGAAALAWGQRWEGQGWPQ